MKNQNVLRIYFLFFSLFILINSSFSQIERFDSLPKRGTVYTKTGIKIRYKSIEEKEYTYVFITSNNTIVEVERSKITRRRPPSNKTKRTSGYAFTNTGTKVKFKRVKGKENTFEFTTINNTKLEIERDKIAQIKQHDGSRLSEYFSITGSTGLLASTAFWFIVTNDRSIFLEPRIIGAYILLPSLIIGTVGGILGSTKKKYKTIYQPFNPNNTLGHLKLEITSPDDIPSLGLVFTF